MKYLYKNKHWPINKEYNFDKILYLMIDRPKRITGFNELIWENGKYEYHRNYDFPANIIYFDDKIISIISGLYWYKNNEQHRDNNKPAYIRWDGYKQYHINGKFIRNEQLK